MTGGEEGLTIDAEVAGGSVNDPSHEMSGEDLVAVDNRLAGRRDRCNLWVVNTEDDHHEGG